MPELISFIHYFFLIFGYLIFIDIILSWFTLASGQAIKIPFISDMLDAIYKSIKKVIPTTFGMFEFAPFIVLISIEFLRIVIIHFLHQL